MVTTCIEIWHHFSVYVVVGQVMKWLTNLYDAIDGRFHGGIQHPRGGFVTITNINAAAAADIGIIQLLQFVPK